MGFFWTPCLQPSVGPLLWEHVEHRKTIIVADKEKTVPEYGQYCADLRSRVGQKSGTEVMQPEVGGSQ